MSEKGKNMFCWNCGNEMKNDDAFCNNCGKPAGRDTGNVRQAFGEITQVKKMSYDQKQIITLAAIVVVLFAVLVGIIMGIREPKNAKRENTKNIFTGITGPKRGDILTEEEIENLDWELNMVVIDGKLLTFPLCEADMPDNVTIDRSEGEGYGYIDYFDDGTETKMIKKTIARGDSGNRDHEPVEDCYIGVCSDCWEDDGCLSCEFAEKTIYPGGIHAGMSCRELVKSLAYLKEELGVDYRREGDEYILFVSGYDPYELTDEMERRGGYSIELDDSEGYVEDVGFVDMTKSWRELYEYD